MKEKKATALEKSTWVALLTFGLIGQIAWVIENMYFNVFLYNTITGDTGMIAAMVSASAVVATVTTLLMGALSDRIGKRKSIMVGGYLLWGLSVMAVALVKVEVLSTLMPAAAAVQTAAVLVIVGLAAGYVIRAKKRGQKCIGCPDGGCKCSGKSCCGCGKGDD